MRESERVTAEGEEEQRLQVHWKPHVPTKASWRRERDWRILISGSGLVVQTGLRRGLE
jgi:hypothetical protein